MLQLQLRGTETRIGRAEPNDVVIPSADIPEYAAVLRAEPTGTLQLVDISGALRCGGRVLPSEGLTLSLDVEVELGEYRLRIEPVSQRSGRTRALDDGPTESGALELLHGAQRYPLRPEQGFGIGTDLDNDLVLDDPFVSAFHCRLRFADGAWWVRDLGSTNGTSVNGLRVEETRLPEDARLELGLARLGIGPADTEGTVSRLHGMLAASKSMKDVFRKTERFAASREPVVVIGASGTGKEGIARALHESSPRSAGPYLALNCGALATGLIETELFGHVKGAFTGATEDRKGAFEATSGGTLFLDEVGELPFELQPKLLRALEVGAIRPVGGTKEVPVDTRIVAATHRDLEELVARGEFRADLFHRLFVLAIRIPPLSERPEDVVALARSFLASEVDGSRQLSRGAVDALLDHAWPGNVRELRNVLVRAALTTDAPTIEAEDLVFASTRISRKTPESPAEIEEERKEIASALERARGNRAAAARILGMSKSTFYDKARRYGI